VLAASLVLLLVLTVLGVAALQNTALDERMAGNLWDQQLSFNAAEAALRFCEQSSAGLPANCNGSNGCLRPAAAGATPQWNSVDWSSAAVESYPVTFSNSPPACIIEQLPRQVSLGAGEPIELGQGTMYRVTGRGVGGTNTAISMVQSTFYHKL
jgi:type IV pilus assembly protein PilX